MTKELKQRIKEFNKIKFNGNNDKRIIIATLGLTIAPNSNKEQANVPHTTKPRISKQTTHRI